jgi:hypothetical protein
MKEHILNALEAHFEAKVLKNQALLQNYLNNPVGIGEHPDIIDECIKITSRQFRNHKRKKSLCPTKKN